mgnify:CR=1 FL=1|tara:strand:- start:508 stop:945 length:438 start_codon:yes stop_codon:yes gene_type:complete
MPTNTKKKTKGVGKKPTPKVTKKKKVATVKKESPPYITGQDLPNTKLKTKLLVASVLTFISNVEITDMKMLTKMLVDNELYGDFVKEVKEAKTELGFTSKVKKYLKKIPVEYLRKNKLTKFKRVDKDYIHGHSEVYLDGNRSTNN